MTPYITEVLKELNDNPDLIKTKYAKHGDGGPLGAIFNYAFVPKWKFNLPEGNPPFKPDSAPIGMSPARFITEVRKFHYFCLETLPKLKREQLFVQTLESIHPSEAKILIAIKDQKLSEMFPKITAKLVAEAGYIEMPAEVKEPKKSVRGGKSVDQGDQ